MQVKQQQQKWETYEKTSQANRERKRRWKFLRFKHKDNFTAAFHTILDLN